MSSLGRDSNPGRQQLAWSARQHRDSLDHAGPAREDGAMNRLLIVLLAACAACTTQAHDPSNAAVQPAPSAPSSPSTVSAGDLLAQIRQAIGTPTCSNSAECRTLAVGARACGGPEAYLAWSTLHGDAGRLQALGERSKTVRQQELKRSGEMSTCIHNPDPGASCVAGTCQLNDGARRD